MSLASVDCRISPTVANALGTGDQAAHFTDCFNAFLEGGFQCPGVTFQQGVTKDTKGRTCESAWPGLKMSEMDWKAWGDFNADPNSAAKAAMLIYSASADDLVAVATMFQGKKAGVVNGQLEADKYSNCAPSCTSGGEACIKIIDGGSDAKDTGSPDTGSPDTGSPDTGPG
jgi:hypothetical protein